ncbi:MAG: glucose-1-phosphate cytidylyltransferase [Limisphaerales bacterium]
MKVVILCGGRGTRLREETEFRPKPMVPVGPQPILWHIMKYYARFGHTDFILCLGYKGDMIKDYFRNYLWNTCDVTLSLGREARAKFHDRHGEEDWNVTLADTGEDSLTARRLKRVRRYIEPGETFFLTYGDGLSDIDIAASLAEHRRVNREVTISAVHPAGRFGALSLDDDGRIHTFLEKPQVEEAYVNGGYMVCSDRVFDYLPEDNVAFEREPIARLVAAGQLHSFKHEGWWQPMDTYQESQYLNQLWAEGRAPWKKW